ncbi:MAG: DUF1295 domain-containing protein [Verrucomicrobiota bacterium]
MSAEFIKAFGIACIFASVVMLGIWWLALRIKNLGIIDIAWSFSLAPIAIFYATISQGDPTRRWLMAGMVALWSLRLGGYLGWRVAKHHPHEDPRYKEFRAKWANHFKRDTFWFFQIQAASIATLSILFLLVCLNNKSQISLIEWIGFAVWLIAFCGESLSDIQMTLFKKNPANKGEVCQKGLWNYSRHPNYFFEGLIWISFYVFALNSPWGWATIYCPAMILYFLLRVTGIPLTEKLAVQTKGEKYRAYQRSTSAFVPWFKKHFAS